MELAGKQLQGTLTRVTCIETPSRDQFGLGRRFQFVRWIWCLVLGMVLTASLLVFPATVFSAKGVVVYHKSDCDYYIVETPTGYALLEWFGGNDPDEGDILVGDYENYGMKTIYNLTADAETRVWVEDYWLSKDGVIEMYSENCS